MTTYLFNIIEDPHETTNVADEHPGMVRELVAMLEAARTEGRPFPHNSDKALVESSSCEGNEPATRNPNPSPNPNPNPNNPNSPNPNPNP